MHNVLESTTIIDHYPAVIDRYFKHRHSIHKGPFHIHIYLYIYMLFIYIQILNICMYISLFITRVPSSMVGGQFSEAL